jgi:hypothetical protein
MARQRREKRATALLMMKRTLGGADVKYRKFDVRCIAVELSEQDCRLARGARASDILEYVVYLAFLLP